MILVMIEVKDIEKLAALARIALSESEKETLRREVDSILDYVGEVQKVSSGLDTERKAGEIRNVMRPDENPHESGAFTEDLLNSAPAREGNYFKVKKIL